MKDVTYPLNQYNLASDSGFMPQLNKLMDATKKDRGLTREISRLIQQLARPSLEGASCVDFIYDLRHSGLGSFEMPDWYARMRQDTPEIRNPLNLQFALMRSAISTLKLWSDTAKRVHTDLLRFTQVIDPFDLNHERLISPVISVVIPTDFEAQSVSQKLAFVKHLWVMAQLFKIENLQSTLPSFAKSMVTGEAQNQPYNVTPKNFLDMMLRREHTLTTTWKINQSETLAGGVEKFGLFLSSYVSRPEAVFLAS